MSRTTTLAVVLALPAGAVLQLAVQAAAHMTADDVSALSKMMVFATSATAFGSAGWYGPKAAIERHEDNVRRRRHRRALPRQLRIVAADRGPVDEELQEPAEAAPPVGVEPEFPAGPTPEPIVEPPAVERPRALDASAVDWPRPPEVDPYLTPAVVDADGYPVPPFRTAEDATRDLAGLGNTQMIQAHREPADGWEQLREPAATRSADDLLWYSPAGPA